MENMAISNQDHFKDKRPVSSLDGRVCKTRSASRWRAPSNIGTATSVGEIGRQR